MSIKNPKTSNKKDKSKKPAIIKNNKIWYNKIKSVKH